MSVATATAISIATLAATAGATVYAANKSSGAAENAAATNAGAQTTAAKLTTDAATHGADLQSKAQADALAFTKTQAQQDQANFAATQRANYDQWLAKQHGFSDLGSMVGAAPREIPAYVPTTDMLSSQPTPQAGMTQPPAAPTLGTLAAPSGSATAVPNGDYQGWFQSLTGGKPLDQKGLLALKPQLDAAGVKITPPSAAGVVSKIGLPDGTWVRVLNGDTSVAAPTVWVPQPGGGSSSAAAPYSMTPAAPTLGSMFAPQVPGNLQIPKPGTLGYYAGIR